MENPQNRVDCHAHIVDPGRFAFQPGVGYSPRSDEAGTSEAFRATLDANGVSHAVLVQPSCYGTDNSAMMDAIANSGGRMKGIVAVGPEVAEPELARLSNAGVVGVRLNLQQSDPHWFERPEIHRLLAMVRELDWFLEVYALGAVWAGIANILADSGVRLLIDHFGAPVLRAGPEQHGFQAVLRLGRDTPAVVKLSAPYRLSDATPDYYDLTPYTEQLIDTFGTERCLWGADWPYLNHKNRDAIHYGELLNNLAYWVPDARQRHRILWSNPQRLFGFRDVT
jgi:predicted TIM-barrel fold metal-dependent hydrolase